VPTLDIVRKTWQTAIASEIQQQQCAWFPKHRRNEVDAATLPFETIQAFSCRLALKKRCFGKLKFSFASADLTDATNVMRLRSINNAHQVSKRSCAKRKKQVSFSQKKKNLQLTFERAPHTGKLHGSSTGLVLRSCFCKQRFDKLFFRITKNDKLFWNQKIAILVQKQERLVSNFARVVINRKRCFCKLEKKKKKKKNLQKHRNISEQAETEKKNIF
jgi:hypothetical protein